MLTKDVASTLAHRATLYHKTERNADKTAKRCRVNGKCKTWTTRPNEFRLPVKYGLYQCFYITNDNAAEWQMFDPTGEGRCAA